MRLGVVLILLVTGMLQSCGQTGISTGQNAAMLTTNGNPFKTAQLKYQRVANAYTAKGQYVANLLKSNALNPSTLELYLRVFKADDKLEVWAKNKQDTAFKLLTEYAICTKSGVLGPKRKQGDKQVPEGFYSINMFNPTSTFHLSLGIDYPNKSDRILGNATDPGGDIFIHGDCVSIGCVPLTDDIIKELYILCLEATDAGQTNIRADIYPTSEIKNLDGFVAKNSGYATLKPFWQSLKAGYDYFEKHKTPPPFSIDDKGNYIIKDN